MVEGELSLERRIGIGGESFGALEHLHQVIFFEAPADPGHPAGDLDRVRVHPGRLARSPGLLRRLGGGEHQAVGLVASQTREREQRGLLEHRHATLGVWGKIGGMLEQLPCPGHGAAPGGLRARFGGRRERGRPALGTGSSSAAREVIRDHLGELGVALAGVRGDPGRSAGMQVDALGAGQRGVGDISDQLVVEAVEPRLLRGSVLDQGAALERIELSLRASSEEVGQRLGAEAVSEHRGVLDRALLLGR